MGLVKQVPSKIPKLPPALPILQPNQIIPTVPVMVQPSITEEQLLQHVFPEPMIEEPANRKSKHSSDGVAPMAVDEVCPQSAAVNVPAVSAIPAVPIEDIDADTDEIFVADYAVEIFEHCRRQEVPSFHVHIFN